MESYDECKAIVELNLDPTRTKLMHSESGEGWTYERAAAAEAGYRRFLYLTKIFPREVIVPMQDVDTFWHYHILDTMKYARDCEAVFGYFLHHFPYVGLGGEKDKATHLQLAERMRRLYQEAFGETDVVLERSRQPDLLQAFSTTLDAAYCAAPGKPDRSTPAYCAAPGVTMSATMSPSVRGMPLLPT